MFFLLRSGCCIGMVLYAIAGDPAREEATRQAGSVAGHGAQAMAQQAASLCLALSHQCLALASASQAALPAKPLVLAPAGHQPRTPANTLNLADTKPAWRGRLPEH